ncbi:MAG: hypothetical protein AAFQ17_01840, partial [Pseudomonadota bacterium]
DSDDSATGAQDHCRTRRLNDRRGVVPTFSALGADLRTEYQINIIARTARPSSLDLDEVLLRQVAKSPSRVAKARRRAAER